MHGGKTTWRHMGRTSCEVGGRDGSVAVMSQRVPRIASGYQKLEQARRGGSPAGFRGGTALPTSAF